MLGLTTNCRISIITRMSTLIHSILPSLYLSWIKMIWKKVQQRLLVPAMESFNSKIQEELRACCINSLRLQHLLIIWKNLYISLIFWRNVFIIYERKMVSATIDYLLNLKINNYIFYLFNKNKIKFIQNWLTLLYNFIII